MKKLIAVFLLSAISVAAVMAFAGCTDGTDAFAEDSANLYAVRAEVVGYLQGAGEMTEEEVAEDLNLYCQRIGDCTFGTGVCDGTGAGKCAALGLTDEQIEGYITQRKAQLDACVQAGLITQEEADLRLDAYETMLKNRASAIKNNQQKGMGICQNENTCSGAGQGNRYCKRGGK